MQVRVGRVRPLPCLCSLSDAQVVYRVAPDATIGACQEFCVSNDGTRSTWIIRDHAHCRRPLISFLGVSNVVDGMD